MKKTLKYILTAFVLLGIICIVFMKLGWLTSANDVRTMFIIAILVIALDFLCSWLLKKIRQLFNA